MAVYKKQLVFSVLLSSLILPAVFANQVIEPRRQQELKNLLLQDCGSCHGMTLKGGLGPALTQDVIVARPRKLLFNTISEGRAGTPMPPWKNILTEDEINWLINILYKGIKNEN